MEESQNVSRTPKPTRRRLSRYGCPNCKLRKLKCDETRPECQRCIAYGVSCNFAFNVGDLQPLRQNQISHNATTTARTILPSPSAPISSLIWSSDGVTTFRLDAQDQGLLSRFCKQTVRSLGIPELVPILTIKMCPESFRCPALMYSVLALVASHDRYLRTEQSKAEYIREVQYSRQCALLFRDWLSRPIVEAEKDAIWTTAITLSIITFAATKVSTYRQAWPLAVAGSDDLQWLRLKANDAALWTIADPTRPGSAFRGISNTLPELGQLLPEIGSAGVCHRLAAICRMDDSSTATSNPYFSFVHALTCMLRNPIGTATLGQAYMVVGVITNEQIALLEAKDPPALLLLYLWYIRARHTRWCIDLRAKHEVPAIRAYLEQYHQDNVAIQAYLKEED